MVRGVQALSFRAQSFFSTGHTCVIAQVDDIPTMSRMSLLPRARASCMDWSVYWMASLTYNPCRSTSPGWLSCASQVNPLESLAHPYL